MFLNNFILYLILNLLNVHELISFYITRRYYALKLFMRRKYPEIIIIITPYSFFFWQASMIILHLLNTINPVSSSSENLPSLFARVHEPYIDFTIHRNNRERSMDCHPFRLIYYIDRELTTVL